MEIKSTKITQPKYYELKDYLRAVRRHKWLIGLCMIAVAIPTAIAIRFITPMYESEATILYNEPKDTMFTLDLGQAFYNKSAVINMTEFLRSRRIAIEVAQTLPEKFVRLYDFPNSLPKNFEHAKYVAGFLMENLGLEIVPGSDILKIRVGAPDPEMARFLTNAYVERIIAWNLRTKREEISNVRDFVDGQLSVFHDKLNTAEDTLRSFKEQNKVISISEASKEILNRMTLAEVRYNEAKTEREAIQKRLGYIKGKIQEQDPSLAVITSPKSQQLKKRLSELEVQYSTNLVNGMAENLPEMNELKRDIGEMKQRVVQELLASSQQEDLLDPLSQVRTLLMESVSLEVDFETVEAKVAGLQEIISNYDAELQQLPEKELLLARLLRNRDVNDKIYAMLLEKREEARITEASKVGDVRIIDAAEAPPHPKKPRKKRILAMGLVVGMMLGVGLAFFKEFFNSSINSQEDVESYLNLPVLASIPKISANGILDLAKSGLGGKRVYSRRLLFQELAEPFVTEAYRALQINFAFANTDRLIKSVMVTSAGPEEGKSLTAVNMAHIFAQSGAKTLLIDCDLRRPVLHQLLGLELKPGLTDLLLAKDRDELAWSIQQPEGSDISVITAGTLPPDPSALLGTQSMREVLAQLRNEFDFIILDSPPLIAVTDPLVLSTHVDAACLLIRSGKANKDTILRAKQLLEKGRAKIIGVILNDVDYNYVYGDYKSYYSYYNGKHLKEVVT